MIQKNVDTKRYRVSARYTHNKVIYNVTTVLTKN